MMKVTLVALIVVLAGFLGFRHWQAGQEAASEAGLRERVNDYWEAVVLNNVHARYEMEASQHEGQLDPFDYYLKTMSGKTRIVAYQIDTIEIQGDAAIAKLDVEKTFPALGAQSYPGKVTNHWIRLDGQWYHDAGKNQSAPSPAEPPAGALPVPPAPEGQQEPAAPSLNPL